MFKSVPNRIVRLQGVRNLSFSKPLAQQLPSSDDMKAQKKWIETDSSRDGSNKSSISSDSVIFKVVQSAKDLSNVSQEPPVNVSPTFTKQFKVGTFYDPFDFSIAKNDMIKRNNAAKRADVKDPFERTGISPLDLYTMPEILSRFLTSTGQILPRSITGCNDANQKKLGIAIKRARHSGLLSTVHKHSRYLPTRNL